MLNKHFNSAGLQSGKFVGRNRILRITKTHSAFTLIELLVVIAIISLLVSILLPSLKIAKELAKTVACLSNCRNLSPAVSMYINDYNGEFPVYMQTNVGLWPDMLAKEGYIGSVDSATCPSLPHDAQTELYVGSGMGSAFVGLGYNCFTLGAMKVGTGGISIHKRRIDALINPAEVYQNMDSLHRASEPEKRGSYLVSCKPDTSGFMYWPAARHNNYSINILYADSHAATMPIDSDIALNLVSGYTGTIYGELGYWGARWGMFSDMPTMAMYSE